MSAMPRPNPIPGSRAFRGSGKSFASALSGKRYTHQTRYERASAQSAANARIRPFRSSPDSTNQTASVATAGSEIAISLLPRASSAGTSGGHVRAPRGESNRARLDR